MKIARPSKPDVPFKRKRSPPPQATKLLRYSFLSAVVFMVLLAIVFLPRMFPDQSPVAVVRSFRFETSPNGTVTLRIEDITASLELTKFRANVSRDGVEIASLAPGLMSGGGSILRFFDVNNTGLLDVGDYFEISGPASGQYRFEIFQVDVGRLVGLEQWTG